VKTSHTPPDRPRLVTQLDHPSSLHVLALVAQAGWIPAPQSTEECDSGPDRIARWTIVMSVPGFPPGIGLGPTRVAARRHAADRLLRWVRPMVNICPSTGRTMYKNREKAHRAVEEQQMLGLGKPLTGEFKCPTCGYWHPTGSGSKVIRRVIKSRKDRPQLPWNARPLSHEVAEASSGERVIVITAGLGTNAPVEHAGQHVAVIIRRKHLDAMLAQLDDETSPADTEEQLPLVYVPRTT